MRDALGERARRRLREVDINRDRVAIDSTTSTANWEQASFTSSATELQQSLNAVIQGAPADDQATLEQVSNALRSLGSQPAETRVLLLFVNRPLGSAGSTNASLGTVRGYAFDNGIQVSIVALPGAAARAPPKRWPRRRRAAASSTC